MRVEHDVQQHSIGIGTCHATGNKHAALDTLQQLGHWCMVRLVETGAESTRGEWDKQDNNTAYNTYDAAMPHPGNKHHRHRSNVILG